MSRIMILFSFHSHGCQFVAGHQLEDLSCHRLGYWSWCCCQKSIAIDTYTLYTVTFQLRNENKSIWHKKFSMKCDNMTNSHFWAAYTWKQKMFSMIQGWFMRLRCCMSLAFPPRQIVSHDRSSERQTNSDERSSPVSYTHLTLPTKREV